ncbi:hypothetical protein MUO14_01935 [Halobacillus shinanisalinarum]|uniref:Uncharacterized protein n=1 Tax=Halobacillus shinanisalinarum TaxID=2932258 RepID=A0ABY4H028_9BACI|nr:hypothetical protein [Halobacillus shinanisalinarum]UOQ93778.1 hypothetical protein MUO14_01935 [Halobacillus shinanisalinarum]
MGDILELLFSNIVIVAAVIGGIISFVSRLNKKEEEKPKHPKRSSFPSGPTNSQQPTMTQEPEEMKETASTSDGRMKEYYEEKQKRLDEMREYQKERGQQATPFSQTNEEFDHHVDDQQDDDSMKRKSVFSNSIQWDKKRLAEGIIMSEVLGPPRAHRPHRSHPRKR